MSSSPFCFLRTSKHIRQAPLYLSSRSQRGTWRRSWQLPLSACSKYSLTAQWGQFPQSQLENRAEGNYRTLAPSGLPRSNSWPAWLLKQYLALLNGARKEQCGDRQTDRQACSFPYHHWTGTEGILPQDIINSLQKLHRSGDSWWPAEHLQSSYTVPQWLLHHSLASSLLCDWSDANAMRMSHRSTSMAFY